MLQVFATQMMHTPVEYPSKYDIRDDVPDYIKPGSEKPPPTARDQRLTTASAMRFVDDIFGQTMQAVKVFCYKHTADHSWQGAPR